VRIEVKDSGCGIPQDKLGGLFEPFNRLEVNTKKIEGTGIGLAISKKLTEMMKGVLEVESAVGRGSTFRVELATCAGNKVHGTTAAEPARLDNLAIDGGELKQVQKILVVEDNPTNLKLISSQLSSLGYSTDLASNGNEALEMTRSRNYALVLTDCNMPVMDGYELTAELRRNDDLTPVIALTADAFPEREQECLAAGMNGRMIKPVSLQQLDSMLEKWL
jgi:CheY-like chemotaxis protein